MANNRGGKWKGREAVEGSLTSKGYIFLCGQGWSHNGGDEEGKHMALRLVSTERASRQTTPGSEGKNHM